MTLFLLVILKLKWKYSFLFRIMFIVHFLSVLVERKREKKYDVDKTGFLSLFEVDDDDYFQTYL